VQISPVIVNGYKNGFHQWIQRIFLVVVEAEKFFSEIFFCFQNLDALYRPVAGKPFVLEELCFGMGTSVASALTAETMFEIIKCISDVDMRGHVRMGSKVEIFRFFNSGYAHDRNISIFRPVVISRGERVGTPFPLLKICRNAWERRSGTHGNGVPIVNKKPACHRKH